MSTKSQDRKLVLFDMDSTLVKVGQWHWQAFCTTLKAVYGLDAAKFYKHDDHAGDTQANLIRAVVRKAGLDEAVIEARLREAVKTLSATVIGLFPADLRPNVLPGVVPLLGALQEAGHALGLVTGTLCPTAGVILQRTRLRRYFPAYACGDEGNERVELLHLAIQRATRIYGLAPGCHKLVVVGDAPRDIQAGQAVGAWVVAVATGSHDSVLLAQYRPDALLPSLEDWPAALHAIVGVPA